MSTSKEQMMKPSRLSILEQEHSASIAVGLVIPSEIKKSEKDMYHVLLVNSDKVGLSEVRFRPRIQVYNSRAWVKVKESIGNQGYEHVSVLHDPTIEVVDPFQDLKNKAAEDGMKVNENTTKYDIEDFYKSKNKVSFQDLKNKAAEDGMEVTPKTTKEDIEEYYKIEG